MAQSMKALIQERVLMAKSMHPICSQMAKLFWEEVLQATTELVPED